MLFEIEVFQDVENGLDVVRGVGRARRLEEVSSRWTGGLGGYPRGTTELAHILARGDTRNGVFQSHHHERDHDTE